MRTTCLSIAIGLVLLVSTGCAPDLLGQDPDDFKNLSYRSLSIGANDFELPAGSATQFEVEVTEGQDIEIIATPLGNAILGIGYAKSPDGYVFSAFPGAEQRSGNGRFRVGPQRVGHRRVGFRFLGAGEMAGVWRFSILAQPPLNRETGEVILKKASVFEKLILFIYLVAEEPILPPAYARAMFATFPELVKLAAPLDISVQINTANAGEYINPDTVTDDGPRDTGDGGDDGGGDGDDGGDNGGDDGGDNGGDDGGDDGNDPPPDPPTSMTVQTIVRTGDAVPDQTDATFTYFGNPIIDDAGRVAFFATYEGGSGTGGLYVWDDGTLKRVFHAVAAEKGVVPGRGGDSCFGKLNIRWDGGTPHMAWGSGGRLLFAAPLDGSPQHDALLRWRASDEDLFLVSDPEIMRTAIADSTEDFLPEMYHPCLSDDGTVLFSNRYSYFRTNGQFALFLRGIFMTTDGVTTDEVAVAADDVPGQQPLVEFSEKPILLTSNNAAGQFLFQAGYQFSAQGDRGVYIYEDGAFTRVADNGGGGTYSGLPSGAVIGESDTDFEAIALGPNGHVVIDTTLTINDVTRDALLWWDGEVWREIETLNDEPVSDLLSGVNDEGYVFYHSAGKVFIGNGNSVTDLTFFVPTELAGATLQWPAFGGAINNNQRGIVRFERMVGDVVIGTGLLFWNGSRFVTLFDSTDPVGLNAIDVIFPEDAHAVDELDAGGTLVSRPETNRPGLSGMVNDDDQAAFRVGYLGPDGEANTADDEQAILLGQGTLN